jgi:MFS family permease
MAAAGYEQVVEVLPCREIPARYCTWSGIAMNLSRVVGPAVAGALLAAVSPAAVFVLNTLLAGVAFFLVLRWKSERIVPERPTPPVAPVKVKKSG